MDSTKKVTVLVTGVGGGGVGEGIVKALKMYPKCYKIIATDMNALSAALYRVDKGYVVPPAYDKKYVNKLLEICKREGAVAIIPGSVPELEVISNNRERFENEGVIPIIASKSVIEIGLDKWKTYNFLKKFNLPYPNTYLANDIDEAVSDLGFPIFIKPRKGYGSRYTYIARDKEDLVFLTKYLRKQGVEPLLQEYITASECTVGVVAATDRQILGSISILRELKSGFSYRMIIDDFKEARKVSEELALKLNITGPLNVQLFLTDKGPMIFEINPRFSGTTPIRSAVGFKEVHAVLRNFLFKEKILLKFKRGVVVIRCLDEIYANMKILNDVKQKGFVEGRKGRRKRYF